MPSPPGAVVDNCEVLLSAERLLRDALPVMQQHTGQAREMKRLGRELDAAATAIGAVAVDTAKKVNMQYALRGSLPLVTAALVIRQKYVACVSDFSTPIRVVAMA